MPYDGEHVGVGKPCSVCGLLYKPLRGGMCRKHYRRTMKNGSPKLTRALGVSAKEALMMHGWTVDEDDCWNWTGQVSSDGYGKITRANRSVRAHRLAYEVWNGPIPEGLLVRHTCDNTLCINPQHLLTGTPKDNTRDMIERGRGAWQKRN